MGLALARASVLHSEDLHHGLLIDGSLRIADPFRPIIEQRAAAYRVRSPSRKPQRSNR